MLRKGWAKLSKLTEMKLTDTRTCSAKTEVRKEEPTEGDFVLCDSTDDSVSNDGVGEHS